MNSTLERLQQFIQVYREECDEEITEDEACEYTARLMRFYELITRPLPSEKATQNESRRFGKSGRWSFTTVTMRPIAFVYSGSRFS
jgi:hypothetical protein